MPSTSGCTPRPARQTAERSYLAAAAAAGKMWVCGYNRVRGAIRSGGDGTGGTGCGQQAGGGETFRRYDQDHQLLLPPDLRSRLPPDHPGRLVDDLVEHGLHLANIYACYTEAPLRPVPTAPQTIPSARVSLTRRHQGFTHVRPSPPIPPAGRMPSRAGKWPASRRSSPRLPPPDGTGAASASTPGFAPRGHPRRTPRRRQARPPARPDPLAQRLGQPGHVRQIGQQPRPACDAPPRPSVVTVVFGRLVVGCTCEVPLQLVFLVPQQDQNPRQDKHFRAFTARVAPLDQAAAANSRASSSA